MRISGALFAALLVAAAGAAPATAQLACPTPTPGPTPPPVRAGFTCTPLAGGGVTNQTTCTFFGDVEWLIGMANGAIPPGTCTFQITFADGNWILCPMVQVSGPDSLAAYEVVPPLTGPPNIEYFGCNVPVANLAGLAALGALVLAFGAFVLWRRSP